jgi:hypothetical protein
MVTTDKATLQSVLTCLQASQAKVELLQIQTQLLHDELQRKNLQHSELVLVQNNPLFDDDDDDDDDQINNQCRSNSVSQLQIQVQMKMKLCMNKFIFLFPIQSSDLGKKSETISTEHVSDMKRKLPFIFQIIPNQSSSKVLDSFKKVHIHLLQFKRRFLNANIVIELATWRINVLIFILVSIVESIIIL